MREGALRGIKVVAFEWIVVGPLATSYLGNHGATVVKVESHIRPDGGRFVAPFKDGIVSPDRSGFFTHQNSSKLSVTFNVKRPKGRDLVLRLLRWADVVLENMTPGVAKKLGFGYEDVVTVNPKIVYVSISVQGQWGPHSQMTGYGQLAAAMGGCAHVAGWPERLPAPPHGAYVDFITARFVPSLILAALDYRNRTGKGQYIDNSIIENTVYCFSLPVLDYVINKRVINRNGNRHPYMCPHGVFRCIGDQRWVAIAVSNQQQWESFVTVVGHPEWCQDPKFASFMSRKLHEDELEVLINQWTMNHVAEEVELMMQRAGVPASTVESNRDLFDDPQLKHRNFFRELRHQAIGSYLKPGPAAKLSKTEDVMFQAPLLGEHNEHVLRDILHLSDDEIADLYAEGAVTTEADFPF
jgi:benzylsuccinate CoA-transferase BbsF subunit